jgi:hypothetical protein
LAQFDLFTAGVRDCPAVHAAIRLTRLSLCEIKHQDVCRLFRAHSELTCPVHEISEQLPYQVLCRLISAMTMRIKPLRCVADHHFGPVEHMDILKAQDLTQVILGASRAECSDGSVQHGN